MLLGMQNNVIEALVNKFSNDNVDYDTDYITDIILIFFTFY